MDAYEPIISKDPSDEVMSDTNNKKSEEEKKKSRCLSCCECFCECFGQAMNTSACCCLSAGLFLMSLGSSR